MIKGDWVFVTGISRNAFSSAAGRNAAYLTALSNLLYIKELEIDTASFDRRLQNIYRRKLFQQYQSIVNIRFTTSNLIKISEFSADNAFACAYACELDNVKFIPADKLSLELVYNTLKQNPQKRNELIFFEIIPEKDIAVLLPEIRKNISKQYGEVFAAMFLDEKIKPLDKKQYENSKKQIGKFNSKTPFTLLIATLNSVPYDPQLCLMLARHFDNLQMPRCAGIMRKCAEKEYEPVFIPEAKKPENDQEKTSAENNTEEEEKTENNPEKTSADSNTEEEEKTESEESEEKTPKVKPVFIDML